MLTKGTYWNKRKLQRCYNIECHVRYSVSESLADVQMNVLSLKCPNKNKMKDSKYYMGAGYDSQTCFYSFPKFLKGIIDLSINTCNILKIRDGSNTSIYIQLYLGRRTCYLSWNTG